jgi:hypothetical protein
LAAETGWQCGGVVEQGVAHHRFRRPRAAPWRLLAAVAAPSPSRPLQKIRASIAGPKMPRPAELLRQCGLVCALALAVLSPAASGALVSATGRRAGSRGTPQRLTGPLEPSKAVIRLRGGQGDSPAPRAPSPTRSASPPRPGAKPVKKAASVRDCLGRRVGTLHPARAFIALCLLCPRAPLSTCGPSVECRSGLGGTTARLYVCIRLARPHLKLGAGRGSSENAREVQDALESSRLAVSRRSHPPVPQGRSSAVPHSVSAALISFTLASCGAACSLDLWLQP